MLHASLKRLAAMVSLFAGVFLSTGAFAGPTNFSFTGTLAADDGVELLGFTTDGSSTVTLRTYSYAGGTQANGNIVPRGGFDPTLALFDSVGNKIASNDDGDGVPADSVTGGAYDTKLSILLDVGAYTVAVSQSYNFANGPTFSDGYTEAGSPFFTAGFGCTNGQFCDSSGDNRSSSWAFDVLDAETAETEVPQPSTASLLGFGLVGLYSLRWRKARSVASRIHTRRGERLSAA